MGASQVIVMPIIQVSIALVAYWMEIEFSHREKILEARRMRASLTSRMSRIIRIILSIDGFTASVSICPDNDATSTNHFNEHKSGIQGRASVPRR